MYSTTELGNKIYTLITLAHFLSAYHSGQWSRGYRYLCLAMKTLRKYKIYHPLEYKPTGKYRKLYLKLVKKYWDKV